LSEEVADYRRKGWDTRTCSDSRPGAFSAVRLVCVTAGTEAAVRVAQRLGLEPDDPYLIQETNNTVVWLRPYPIIAKVGPHDYSSTMLHHEVEVASALTAAGAPIAAPWRDVGLLTDPETGFVISLWNRHETVVGAAPGGISVARSLHVLHNAMARISVPLPSFRDAIARAQVVAARDQPMAALDPDDCEFLRRSFAELSQQLDDCTYLEQPLHGEPHENNYLLTREGIRWIDFEGACRGPLEWDLAFLGDESRSEFEGIDRSLLQLLMSLNSARVATWCWVQARFPEMRRQGEHHLTLLRTRLS